MGPAGLVWVAVAATVVVCALGQPQSACTGINVGTVSGEDDVMQFGVVRDEGMATVYGRGGGWNPLAPFRAGV
jgi:hypothetical protein